MKKICYYDNKNIISEKLKALREQKGLSQSNLAAKLQTMNVNIDQQMISKIEKNNRQVTDYELACGDVTGDGVCNIKDFQRLLRHVNKTNPLF